MSMHADEESDEGVVPMKRSNNEGVSSAETVEGRTSPKGNGGQTAAARTQRRDTASNGLGARRDPCGGAQQWASLPRPVLGSTGSLDPSHRGPRCGCACIAAVEIIIAAAVLTDRAVTGCEDL